MFLYKILYVFLLPSMYVSCPANLISRDLIALVMSGLVCSPLQVSFSCLSLWSNVLLSTLFSNTLMFSETGSVSVLR
jgi:hypothetical protein